MPRRDSLFTRRILLSPISAIRARETWKASCSSLMDGLFSVEENQSDVEEIEEIVGSFSGG